MTKLPSDLPYVITSRYLGPARVVRVEDDAVHVVLSEDARDAAVVACNACDRTPPMVAGDQVLVTGDPANGLFVIGRLSGAARSEPDLRAQDGTTARVSADATRIDVRRADGALLFRYEVGAGRGRVVVESEDIEMRSRGAMRFAARGALTVDAGSFRLRSGEARAEIDRGVLVARRLETLATTVVERARNVYRSVKELTQLRTGRLRTLVEGTSWMLAGRVAHRAKTDYKIDAEKIHLG